MAKAVTVNQIRDVPFALALAFACAWMLDPSAAIPAGFASLVSFSQYSHLLVTSLAFGRPWPCFTAKPALSSAVRRSLLPPAHCVFSVFLAPGRAHCSRKLSREFYPSLVFA